MPRSKRVDLKDAVEMILNALKQLFAKRSLNMTQFEECWHQLMTKIAFLFTKNDLVYYYLFLDAVSLVLTGNEEDVHDSSDFIVRCLFLAYYTQPNEFGTVPEGVYENLVPAPPENPVRCEPPVKISQKTLDALLVSCNQESRSFLNTLKGEGGLLICDLPLMESSIIINALKVLMKVAKEEQLEMAIKKVEDMQREEEKFDLKRTLKEDVDKVAKVEKEFWQEGTHPYVTRNFSSQLSNRIKK